MMCVNNNTTICIMFLCIVTILSKIQNKYTTYLIKSSSVLFAVINIFFNKELVVSFKGKLPMPIIIVVIIYIVIFFIALTYKQFNKYSYLHTYKDKFTYFIKGCICIPIFEELFYRGYLQSAFILTFNMYITTFIVSVIFIINHTNANNRKLYLYLIAPIFSYFSQYNMLYNIVLHMIVNTSSYIKFYHEEVWKKSKILVSK